MSRRVGAVSSNFKGSTSQQMSQMKKIGLQSAPSFEVTNQAESQSESHAALTRRMQNFFMSDGKKDLGQIEKLQEIISKSNNQLNQDNQVSYIELMSEYLKIDFKIHVEAMEEYDTPEGHMFHVHDQSYLLCQYSLNFISSKNFIRKWSAWIVHWNYFNGFILVFIVLNSVSLAFYDYSDRENYTLSNQRIEQFQYIFSIIFFVEAVLKIIALGFYKHKNAYLKNQWNIMDFVIVVISFFDFFPDFINLKILRVFRVLKPLKSINAVPAMKLLVSTFFKSIPKLANVSVFLVFNLTLFSILGIQQYSGTLYSRCRTTEFPVNATYWPKNEDIIRVCSKNGKGFFTCPEDNWCGAPADYGISLEDDGVYKNANIQFGINNFDNMLEAFLGVIQMITCDSWTVIMFNFMDVDGLAFASIYCSTIIIFGSFFLVNLILAVIMESFVQIYQEQVEYQQQETQKKNEEFERKQQLKKEAAKAKEKMKKLKEKQGGSMGLLTVLSQNIGQKELEKIKKSESVKEGAGEKVERRSSRLGFIKMKTFVGLFKRSQQNTPDSSTVMNNSQQSEEQTNNPAASLAEILRLAKKQKEEKEAEELRSENTSEPWSLTKALLREKEEAAKNKIVQSNKNLSLGEVLQRAKNEKIQKQQESQMELGKLLSQAKNKKRQDAFHLLGATLSQAKEKKKEEKIQAHRNLAQALIRARIEKKAYESSKELAHILDQELHYKRIRQQTHDAQVNLGLALKQAKLKKHQQESQRSLAQIIEDHKKWKKIDEEIKKDSFGFMIKTLKRAKIEKKADESLKQLCKYLKVYKEIRDNPARYLAKAIQAAKKKKREDDAGHKLGALLNFARRERELEDIDGGGPPQGGNVLAGLFAGLAGPKKPSKQDEMMKEKLQKEKQHQEYHKEIKDGLNDAKEISDINHRIFSVLELMQKNAVKLQNLNTVLALEFKDTMKDQYGQNQDQNEQFKTYLQENNDLIHEISQIDDPMEVDKKVFELEKTIKQQIVKKKLVESMGTKLGQMFEEKKLVEQIHIDIENQMQQAKFVKRTEQNIILQGSLKIIQSTTFEFFIMGCILANTVVLAMDKYPSTPEYDKTLEQINLFFFWAFLFEMIFKLLGLGRKYYFADSSNSFDCFIVTISVVDVILSNIGSISIGTGGLSSLRTLRLLRIFKLVKIWKSFQTLLKTIFSTIKDLSAFGVFLSLFIYIYAMIGMELFAHKVRFNDNDENDLENGTIVPDFTFDSLIYAVESVFIVLANDGWSTIYFDHYRAGYKVTSTIFFYSLLLIGQYVILNLFFATLLQNFEEDSLTTDAEKKEQEQKKELMKKRQQEEHERILQKIQLGLFSMNTKKEEEKPKGPPDRALFILDKNNRFRVWLTDIRLDARFDTYFSILIVLNSIALAIDNPLNDPSSPLMQVLSVLEYIFNLLFFIEAMILILSKGLLFNGDNSYLRDMWNILDFIVVIISFITTFQNQLFEADVSFLRTLRLLRILRPLKMIKRNKGLQICVMSLVHAIPNLINITAISIIVLLIFAIVGISKMKGQFFYCDTYFISMDYPPIETKWDCLAIGGIWRNYIACFDNVFVGMQSLYQMTATVGWAAFMTQGMATVDIDFEPQQNNNPGICFFYMLFMVCGSMFIGNLFVCIVISAFNREKDLLGRDFLKDDDEDLNQIKLITVNAKPVMKLHQPQQAWRLPFYHLAVNNIFNDVIIFSCIFVNTLVLCIKYYDMSENVTRTLEITNTFFGFVFMVEAVMKIIGLGRDYFKVGWNVFDLSIVIMSSFITGFSYLSGGESSYGVVINALRICRVFKMLKKFKKLQIIYQTILNSVPQLANVGALLALFLFIYTVLGVNLFATIKFSGSMSIHLNFQSFFFGMLTLLRATTGENWHDLLKLLSRSKEQDYECIKNPSYQDYVDADYETVGCGNKLLATIYFDTFYLFGSMIFLNLFIGIVLQGFSDTNKIAAELFTKEVQDIIIDKWGDQDPDASGILNKKQLFTFLFECGPMIGMDPVYKGNKREMERFLINLNVKPFRVPNMPDRYQFDNVYEAIALRYVVLKQVQTYHEEAKKEKEKKEAQEKDEGQDNKKPSQEGQTSDKLDETNQTDDQQKPKLSIHKDIKIEDTDFIQVSKKNSEVNTSQNTSDLNSEKNDVMNFKSNFEEIKEVSINHEETIDPKTPQNSKKLQSKYKKQQSRNGKKDNFVPQLKFQHQDSGNTFSRYDTNKDKNAMTTNNIKEQQADNDNFLDPKSSACFINQTTRQQNNETDLQTQNMDHFFNHYHSYGNRSNNQSRISYRPQSILLSPHSNASQLSLSKIQFIQADLQSSNQLNMNQNTTPKNSKQQVPDNFQQSHRGQFPQNKKLNFSKNQQLALQSQRVYQNIPASPHSGGALMSQRLKEITTNAFINKGRSQKMIDMIPTQREIEQAIDLDNDIAKVNNKKDDKFDCIEYYDSSSESENSKGLNINESPKKKVMVDNFNMMPQSDQNGDTSYSGSIETVKNDNEFKNQIVSDLLSEQSNNLNIQSQKIDYNNDEEEDLQKTYNTNALLLLNARQQEYKNQKKQQHKTNRAKLRQNLQEIMYQTQRSNSRNKKGRKGENFVLQSRSSSKDLQDKLFMRINSPGRIQPDMKKQSIERFEYNEFQEYQLNPQKMNFMLNNVVNSMDSDNMSDSFNQRSALSMTNTGKGYNLKVPYK